MEEKDFEFETEVIDEEEFAEETETTESEGFLSKVKRGFKKHGKKIAIGTAIILCGLGVYIAGKKSSDENDSDWDSDEEINDDEVLLIENDSNDEPNEE